MDQPAQMRLQNLTEEEIEYLIGLVVEKRFIIEHANNSRKKHLAWQEIACKMSAVFGHRDLGTLKHKYEEIKENVRRKYSRKNRIGTRSRGITEVELDPIEERVRSLILIPADWAPIGSNSYLNFIKTIVSGKEDLNVEAKEFSMSSEIEIEDQSIVGPKELSMTPTDIKKEGQSSIDLKEFSMTIIKLKKEDQSSVDPKCSMTTTEIKKEDQSNVDAEEFSRNTTEIKMEDQSKDNSKAFSMITTEIGKEDQSNVDAKEFSTTTTEIEMEDESRDDPKEFSITTTKIEEEEKSSADSNVFSTTMTEDGKADKPVHEHYPSLAGRNRELIEVQRKAILDESEARIKRENKESELRMQRELVEHQLRKRILKAQLQLKMLRIKRLQRRRH